MAKAYALRVKPELSVSDAKKAEQQLNSRFRKVADKYGDEMQKQNSKTADDFSTRMKGAFGKLKSGWAIAAGALAGIVGAVLSNPIDEADARLNDFLKRIDNLQTRAQQWEVSPEKYLVASEIAQTAGAGEVFDQALLRVAERLEQARTGDDPTLKQFLGAGDIVDAFFQLVQTWQQMNPQSRAASMADILGARQANQFAELVQTDWMARAQEILKSGGVNYGELRKAIKRGADLEEMQSIMRSGLRLSEITRLGGGGISEETIATQNRLESLRQNEALDDVVNYVKFAKSEIAKIETMSKTVDVIKDGVNEIAGYLATEFGILGKEEQAKQRAERKANRKAAIAKKDAAIDATLKGTIFEGATKLRAPEDIMDLIL